MSPLARRIYSQLRRRVNTAQPSITYGELATELAIHQRSPKLHAALGEVTNACRHAALPCLPALVWRADMRRPSAGYYKAAHPRAATDAARISAWQREHAAVIVAAARFPPRL